MENYAIVENGVVTNVIVLHPLNADDFPSAVPLGDIPATMGDAYENGVFYRNGQRLRSHSEGMTAEMNDLRDALNVLGVSVDE